MTPPWDKYPNLERQNIGWRMGYEEEYYDQFYKWFSNLIAPEQDGFVARNPEPNGWEGFYDMIRKNPWLA